MPPVDNGIRQKPSGYADGDSISGMPGTLDAVTARLRVEHESESSSRHSFHKDFDEQETAQYLSDMIIHDNSLYRDTRPDSTKREREHKAWVPACGLEESSSDKVNRIPCAFDAEEGTHRRGKEYNLPPNVGGDTVAVRSTDHDAQADNPLKRGSPESGSKKRTSCNKTAVDFFPTSGDGNTHQLQGPPCPNKTPAFDRSSSLRPTRPGLPLIIQGKPGLSGPVNIDVTACPDTGTDLNIISMDMIQRLGLSDDIVKARPGDKQYFLLPNRRSVKAAGSVTTKVLFGHSDCRRLSADSIPVSIPIECQFYIFNSLIVDVVMGRRFLDETETLTKHPERLVEELVPAVEYPNPMANSTVLEQHRSSESDWSGGGILSHCLPTLLSMLQCWLIGSCLSFRSGVRSLLCRLRFMSTTVNTNMGGSLACRLDSHIEYASTDTGSEINLVSSNFAISRGFHVLPGADCHELQFADGSTGLTDGSVKVKFCVGFRSGLNNFIEMEDPVDLEFHVFGQLNVDILVGQDALRWPKIFEQNSELLNMGALLASPPRISSLGIIRMSGRTEQRVNKGWKGAKNSLNKWFCKIIPSRALSPSPRTSVVPEDDGPLEVEAQRENAQQEKARREVSQILGLGDPSPSPRQPAGENVVSSTQQVTDDNAISVCSELP